MNLLFKREEIKTARTGSELLRNKRDVLLAEFFSTVRTLMASRQTLDAQSYEATQNLAFSLGLEGKEKLDSFSFIAPRPLNYKIAYKNLLGLKIPEVVCEYPPGQEGYAAALIDTAEMIKETRNSFCAFLRIILKTLPQELKLKRLGQEIKDTTRKVNSLEKLVIPQLNTQIKYIRENLDEREREDVFRLKRLKKYLIR